MENYNNKRQASSTLAFLLGAMAGGITALLLAPKSGAETRSGLKRRAGELREKGQRLARHGEERAETVTGTFKDAMHEAKDTYRTEMDKQRSGLNPSRSAETEPFPTRPSSKS